MSAKKPNPNSSLSAGVKKTKVLLVDDHPIVREGLVRVLERESDLEVTGQAGSVREALEQIEQARPDFAIVDISLAGRNGIELIKQMRLQCPQLPILVHSMHEESVYAERALRAGASGYLMKQEAPEKLVQAIRTIMQGEICLNRTAVRQLVHRLAAGAQTEETTPLLSLTEREFAVFRLIGQGHGSAQVAEALSMGKKTVQVHREHIKRKLGLKDGTSLVHFAIQWMESQS
ncbi:MAG: response regulator transcription factor [Verrucomicrobia bacterium]|nr:response regulator transcription factor [Verrucomicrobiota bacterium]